MLAIYEITIIIVSLFLIKQSIKKTLKTNNSIYIIHLLFCFVFVVPLILDYLLGYPNYSAKYYGFLISYNDPYTRFYYATYILTSQCIMLIIGRSKTKYKYKLFVANAFSFEMNIYIDFILSFTAFITVLLVLVFPLSKSILWNFGWRDSEILLKGEKYYSTVERLSYISLSSALIFILKNKRSIITYVFYSILIYMLICIQSKRSIIFFIAAMIVSYLFFNTKMDKRKWIYCLGCISVIGLLLYSIYIKVVYRGYIGFENLYTTIRIDFFRDDTVKMVIYSLLNPEKMRILKYPGQSIITQIGTIFPLQFLKVPYMGYNSYLTSALIGTSVLDVSINWMTTSIFDEMIANFGFFGFWIAPTILGFMAKIANKQNNKLIIITISSVVLLIMYSLSYIMWYIQFWIGIIVIEKYFNRFHVIEGATFK